MPINVKSKKATASVATTLKDHSKVLSEDVANEEVAVPSHSEGSILSLTEPWCLVGYEAGFTKNLGNYQSASIRVVLHIPARHGEIDALYEHAVKWVNTRLEDAVNALSDDEASS